MRQGEIIISLFLIGFGVTIWISSAGFVSETSMASMNRTLGAAFYPRLIVGCIVFCSTLLLVRALRARSSQGAIVWGRWYSVPIAVGVMLFQVLTFEELSWIPSAWLTLFMLMRMTRVQLWKSLVIPSGFIIFVYLFFILLLQLQLPTEFLPTLFG